MADQLAVESLLAAIGIDAILRAHPTLHKYQIEKAAELPREIRRRVLRFLATSEFTEASDYPRIDYHAVLKSVSDGQTPEQAHALFAAVPDHEMATDLGIEVGRVLTWANQALPRQERDAVTGPQIEEPDAQAVAEFQSLWEVARDPLIVLRDLAEGCLTPEQVGTVALLYPALYAEMRQAIVDGMIAMVGRKGKDWEPAPSKVGQIKTLRQEDSADPTLAAAIQQVYAAAPEPAPAPPRPSGAGGDVEGELTPGQRASA